MMSTRRTGPFKAIYASTTIPGTSAVAMTEFVADGNAVKLFITTTGTPNTVTISARIAYNATGTFFTFPTTWDVEFSGAGSKVINLDGIGLCPGDIAKLYYQAETANGAIAVWALNYETTGSGGGSSSLSGSTIGDASSGEVIEVGAIARSTEQTAVDAGDAVNLVTTVNGELVTANYDWTGDYGRVAEQDPIWLQGEPTTVAAVTNGTDGTYSYYIDCTSVKCLSIQGIIGAGSGSVTVTLEATNEPTTAAASCTYIDVTNLAFQGLAAASAASYTASFMVGSAPYFRARYVKVKVVANTGGANDGDWTIYAFDPAI